MRRERVERGWIFERTGQSAKRGFQPAQASGVIGIDRQQVAKRLHRFLGRSASDEQQASELEQTQRARAIFGRGAELGFEQRQRGRDRPQRSEPAGGGDRCECRRSDRMSCAVLGERSDRITLDDLEHHRELGTRPGERDAIAVLPGRVRATSASVISVSTSGNPCAFVLAGPGPAPLEDAAAGLCDSRRGRVLFSFASRRIVVL